jgi:iron complex transport system substrate-binding protein
MIEERNMEKKPILYVLTAVIIAVILVSAFLVVQVNSLQDTINQQNNQLNQYNQNIDNQQNQLAAMNQTLNNQNQILGQYNQTITQQNATINQQGNQINQYNQTISQQSNQLQQSNQTINQLSVVTVVDDYGYVVNFTSAPTRIVSLAPSNTEILFAVGAGNQVIGVTKYCDYPYNFTAWVAAGNMSSIGSYYHPAIEPIVALHPDLVIASGSASDQAAAKLRDLGYKVIILDARNLNGVLNDLYLVGKATGHSDQAASVVSGFRARIDVVQAKAANATTSPKVYYETATDPLMAAGPNTFVSDVVKIAGGKNIFDDASTQWPTVSSDSVITKNPDVILSYHTDGFSTRPGWSTIGAVANNKIYSLPSSMFTRPGPRLVDALEAVAKILHPEIFGKYS